MSLIAGYNEKSAHLVVDKPGLARLIGRMCFLVGLGAAVMPITTAVWGGSPKGFYVCMGAFGGYLAGIVGFVSLQARDYTKKHRRSSTS
jgi:presenilin-like A22 family membrane protease